MAKLAMPPHSVCHGGSLDTYSVDVGYSITPEFETSIGYYYQKGDLGKTDGSSVQGRIVYNMGKGFSIGTNLPYDDAFDERVSSADRSRGLRGWVPDSKTTPEGVAIPLRRITQRLEYK